MKEGTGEIPGTKIPEPDGSVELAGPAASGANPKSPMTMDDYYYSDEEATPEVEVYGEHEGRSVPYALTDNAFILHSKMRIVHSETIRIPLLVL